MTEAEGEHRRELEKTIVNKSFSEGRLGQIFAAIIAVVGLVVAGFSAYGGHEWTGSIIGGASLALIVTPFLRGKIAAAEVQPKSHDEPNKGRRQTK